MLIKEQLKQLLDYTDRNGKKLTYNENDNGKIHLEIDGQTRCLGSIIIGDGYLLYLKYDDEREIFRKTNAWSINENVLKHVDYVQIETMTHTYLITKERAFEFGQYFHFQDTTELKLYIPLIYWEKRHKGLAGVFPEENKHRNIIGDSWYEVMKDTMKSEMFNGISKFIKERRLVSTVFPTSDRVFRAFKLCTFNHTKVVILGQDPYHDGSADGLAFSYLHGSRKAVGKSLDVIYKEVERDIHQGFYLDHDYNLDYWAKQGVLLLNTILTVEKGKALSHAGIGWERFTKIVTYNLLMDETPKVFMVWGAKPKEHMQAVIDVVDRKWAETKPLNFTNPHLILYSPHPASDLYQRNTIGLIEPNFPKTFSGCGHFSQANGFLFMNGRKEIKW